jgi:uncharacterized damage-inducible protein DinB
MDLLTHLRRMFRYTAWANQRTLGALRDVPAARAEGLPLYAHLLSAESVWLARLEQREAQIAIWPQSSLEECERITAANVAGYTEFLDRLREDDLTRPIPYCSQYGTFETPALDMLTQVLNHGTYHRGQIAKCLGRAGTPAVNTDFITFQREGN